MTWEVFYLVCFGVGLVLSLVSFIGGFGHLHFGHGHFGHGHFGHTQIGHAGHVAGGPGAKGMGHGSWLSGINGFTLTAFLCWFGGAGYLLQKYTSLLASLVMILALFSGVLGAAIVWVALFKILLPHERILTLEESEMGGVVARVSHQIREGGGIGEIIFSQSGSRHASAARSEDGSPMVSGTEVVVLRYEHGIAYVRRWDELTNHVP